MPRAKVPISSEHHYHLTGRANNRAEFWTGMDLTWNIYEAYLSFLGREMGVKTLSFVMMPNHFHWIARFPNENLSDCLMYFMRETSRAITRESGRINHTYGGRHHKCMINSYHYLLHAYKYVYQNPLRAKLVTKVEDYPYSTLPILLGNRPTPIVLTDDLLLTDVNQIQGTLAWLNKLPPTEDFLSVQKALKKSTFAIGRNQASQAHHLEKELL